MSKILICTYEEALLPFQGTPGAACRDLSCSQDFEVKSSEIAKIWTGIKTALPHGRAVRMYARSSLPSKIGLMLANGVAVIDSDYRGEYLLQLYNFTAQTVKIQKWTRLAQIEFFPHLYIKEGKSYFWTENFSKEPPELQWIVDANLYNDFANHYPSQWGEWGLGSTGK